MTVQDCKRASLLLLRLVGQHLEGSGCSKRYLQKKKKFHFYLPPFPCTHPEGEGQTVWLFGGIGLKPFDIFSPRPGLEKRPRDVPVLLTSLNQGYAGAGQVTLPTSLTSKNTSVIKPAES